MFLHNFVFKTKARKTKHESLFIEFA